MTLITISIDVRSIPTPLTRILLLLPSMFLNSSLRNNQTTTSSTLSVAGWIPTPLSTLLSIPLNTGTTLRRAFRSPNPALDVVRQNEAVACNNFYSDVPSIDDGSTVAVLFVDTDTQVTGLYGIKTDKQFINIVEANITNCVAPHKPIGDCDQVCISHKVLRALCI
jgi:hypothetical protein